MSEKGSICYVATSFAVKNDFRFAHKQCPGLVKRGFEVCYYAQANKPEVIGGAKIYPIKKAGSLVGQALSPWKILSRVRKEKCDAFHLSNAELLPIAILLKLITRRKVVFDFREDYVEFVRLKPYLKGPMKWLAVAFTRVLIWLVCKSVDGAIFGDEGVMDTYPKFPEKRVMLVHHFPLLDLFDENKIDFSDRKYDLIYLGTMSKTGGIFVMLEAITLLLQKKPDLKVLFVGEPVAHIEKEFYDYIEENGLKDIIEITGKIRYPEVPALLDQAKVGLIGLLDLHKFHKQSATKLFEYMAKGVPCVSVDLPPERRFMEDGKEGYFVPPEKPEEMADAVFKIISNEELGSEMAKNCRDTFMNKKYYAENEMDKLAQFYEYVISQPRRWFCGNS